MPTRLSRTSACCRRFAGREALTVDATFARAVRARPLNLRNDQSFPDKSIGLLGELLLADALVFEFMGLAMLALCIVVLAVPSGRRPARYISDA
jgi:hypothetical protein